MSPTLSTAMLTMSGLKSRFAIVAVGKSILIDCNLIMLKLAIMNDASRKNMISISGMISMRAFFFGIGVPILMRSSVQLRFAKLNRGCRRLFRRTPEFDRVESLLLRRVDHHFDIGRRRFELELQFVQLAAEKVERHQRQNR